MSVEWNINDSITFLLPNISFRFSEKKLNKKRKKEKIGGNIYMYVYVCAHARTHTHMLLVNEVIWL